MAPPITRNTGDKNPETLLTVPRILHIVLKENVRCAHTNIYEGAASMIFEKLKSLIAEQFNVDEDSITMETSFADDLNADSVDIVDLSMALEEEFGIDELTEEETASISTVGDLVRFLQGKVD